jgi:hypothetical protein
MKKLQTDIQYKKSQQVVVIIIEEEIDAISSDLHTFRPEYIRKLKKIDKEGKFNSFKTIGELRNAIEAIRN